MHPGHITIPQSHQPAPLTQGNRKLSKRVPRPHCGPTLPGKPQRRKRRKAHREDVLHVPISPTPHGGWHDPGDQPPERQEGHQPPPSSFKAAAIISRLPTSTAIVTAISHSKISKLRKTLCNHVVQSRFWSISQSSSSAGSMNGRRVAVTAGVDRMTQPLK